MCSRLGPSLGCWFASVLPVVQAPREAPPQARLQLKPAVLLASRGEASGVRTRWGGVFLDDVAGPLLLGVATTPSLLARVNQRGVTIKGREGNRSREGITPTRTRPAGPRRRPGTPRPSTGTLCRTSNLCPCTAGRRRRGPCLRPRTRSWPRTSEGGAGSCGALCHHYEAKTTRSGGVLARRYSAHRGRRAKRPRAAGPSAARSRRRRRGSTSWTGLMFTN